MNSPGYCRWCAAPILRPDGQLNRRRNWCNTTCVGKYLIRADPKVMRHHVFVRDQGVCYDCGKKWDYLDDAWDADHVKPLFMSFGDLSFWEPENVVVLCRDDCHKRKSARDILQYGHPSKRFQCDVDDE